MKKLAPIFLIIFLVSFLSACSPFQIKGETTAKDTLLYAQSIYIEQYDLYQTQADRKDLTEDQKKILRAKKAALVELEGKIKLLRGYVLTGVIPSKEIEEEIILLIGKLLEGI